MKNLLMSVIALIAFGTAATAQKFITKNGKISFFSKTSMENIEAVNNQVISYIDSKTGAMAFSVQINGFLFKKALMQEHFNENYMESDKYPKASFKGSITDISKVNFTKDGTYPVTVAGDLTIHNVTNKVSVPGTLAVTGGKVHGTATFNALLADYNITVPKVVENNISKSIEIKVDCNYDPQ